MTNEQVITRIKHNQMYKDDRETADYIIKALEQQPSEDCVSREGARQFLYEEIDRLNNDELYDIFSKIIDDMYNELPPVTPTRKSGLHWIERSDNESMWLECPHCHIDSIAAYNYCPNCGADMRGNENEDN